VFGTVAALLAACHPVGMHEASAQEATSRDEIIVTLLGTGTPEPRFNRFGAATLVQAGGLNLLFDAGRGVTIRLYQIGVSSGKDIHGVFLTHYHSDHVSGLPDLWMTGYMFGPFGSRAKPLRLWGPSENPGAPGGVDRLANGLTEAFADDMRIRHSDEGHSAEAMTIEPHAFHQDGVIFEEAGVKVTAFAVKHGERVKPAVGYRVDYRSRSVTISGDAQFDENLIRHAMGTDVLIHEVCAISERLTKKFPQLVSIAAVHTSPEEAGTVFSRVKPKLGVYTHLVTLDATPEEVVTRTRGIYQGPLEAGEDLMRFIIGDSVTVKKWDPAQRKYPG
jgi:ribonuclease Z